MSEAIVRKGNIKGIYFQQNKTKPSLLEYADRRINIQLQPCAHTLESKSRSKLVKYYTIREQVRVISRLSEACEVGCSHWGLNSQPFGWESNG